MKPAIYLALFSLISLVVFAQDEPIMPYESPEDITVRTGWDDVALNAYVESIPMPSQSELILTDGLNRENEGAGFVSWGWDTSLDILVDLGEVKEGLKSFRLFWGVDFTGLGGPVGDYVNETQVSISIDGTNYTDLGVATSEDMSQPGTTDYTIRHCVNDLTLDQAVTSRYVYFSVEDMPQNVMCSEIAVLREISIPSDATNIAVDKPYVTDPPGNDGSRPDDGIRLTDGALAVAASTDVTGWSGFTSADEISTTIDLGKVEENLVAFRAWYNAWEIAFVFVVGTVYVEVSEDGNQFTRLGFVPKLYDHDDYPPFSNVPYLLIPGEPVSARYVRFLTMGSDDNTFDVFASEFEVYQGVPTSVSGWELF
ncbi:MAG: discoidin domain-containing protein [bacterium]